MLKIYLQIILKIFDKSLNVRSNINNVRTITIFTYWVLKDKWRIIFDCQSFANYTINLGVPLTHEPIIASNVPIWKAQFTEQLTCIVIQSAFVRALSQKAHI